MSESFWWEEIWKKEHNPHIRDTYIKNWQDWDTTARVAREAFKDEA